MVDRGDIGYPYCCNCWKPLETDSQDCLPYYICSLRCTSNRGSSRFCNRASVTISIELQIHNAHPMQKVDLPGKPTPSPSPSKRPYTALPQSCTSRTDTFDGATNFRNRANHNNTHIPSYPTSNEHRHLHLLGKPRAFVKFHVSFARGARIRRAPRTAKNELAGVDPKLPASYHWSLRGHR